MAGRGPVAGVSIGVKFRIYFENNQTGPTMFKSPIIEEKFMSLKSNLTGQIIRHGGSEAYFRLIIQASKISLLSSLAPMD